MSYLTDKTGERRGGITEVPKVPWLFVMMDDNVVVVVVAFIGTAITVIRLAVDPEEDNEVAEGSIKLNLIVGRLMRTGLTCTLEFMWAVLMVNVLLAASYFSSVGSCLRL